jgi:hypothetical protein
VETTLDQEIRKFIELIEDEQHEGNILIGRLRTATILLRKVEQLRAKERLEVDNCRRDQSTLAAIRALLVQDGRPASGYGFNEHDKEP